MHLPPSLLLPRTGLFTRRVHENRAVHCHLHPPNLTSVHHSAVDKHPAPRLTDWRRRGRNRERDTPTVFYTTHTRITAPTHPRTTTTQLPLPLPSLYGHLHRVPWSQSLHAARPLCFLTPHSSRVNTHSSTCALLAPVYHENNRRRLFTHRGNPLAMHRSGTHAQHPSLGRS